MIVTLRADGLASKWGFQDGDILEDFDLPDGVDDHDVLIRLVRTHLLPLLPDGLEVDEIGTCHNPIRASNDWHEFCEDSDVTVEVTDAMVQSAAAAVLLELAGALDSE